MIHKAAIIGYGGMAGWHERVIKERVPEIEIKGAFDVRPEALERAAESGLVAYESLDALLNDKELDIIIISTPNNFHKDLSIASMRHGKHVICEKPVTMNATELLDIMAVQRETGLVFSAHQNRRWDNDFRTVLETINQGLIGKPYFIESRIEGSRQYLHGWRGHKINGGGMLLDWGVHLIDQLMWGIKEKVVSIFAELVSVSSKEVEDNCKLVLRFESGLSAHIDLFMNSFINLPRFRVMGTEGTVVVKNWSGTDGEIVKLGDETEPEWKEHIVYTDAGPTRSMALRPKHTILTLPLPTTKVDNADYYRNFAAVVEGKAEIFVKPEESLRVMKVLDLAFQSNTLGQSIKCEI